MRHVSREQAIILRSFDVGDADRFCILLTRGAGRLAARARGVRKPGSRMGAVLLPLQRVNIELTESSTGFLITSASPEGPPFDAREFGAFAVAQEGIELLLGLVQDGDPVPEIFDALETFLGCCVSDTTSAFSRFTFRLLALMGLFPEEEMLEEFGPCTPLERSIILAAASGEQVLVPVPSIAPLRQLAHALLHAHLSAPLRAGKVREAMSPYSAGVTVPASPSSTGAAATPTR